MCPDNTSFHSHLSTPSMARKFGWFGPSKEEIWQQFCEEIDGDFIPGGFKRKDKVFAYHRQWVITLDTYVVSNGKTSTTYTRMRAPYVNWDDFKFRVFREHFFTGLGKVFGMQDVIVGYPEFDQNFVIQGNDERKLRMMFDDALVRELVDLQPKLHFEIRHDNGWFKEKFPQGVNELYFQTIGTVKDLNRLLDLYDLFAEVLDHLCRIGTAYEDDPGIEY